MKVEPYLHSSLFFHSAPEVPLNYHACHAGQWGNLVYLAHGSAREVANHFADSAAGGLVLLGECLLPDSALPLALLNEWTR